MTLDITRPCTYPGCGALVRRSSPGYPRCPRHPYAEQYHRRPDTRRNAGERGYDADWRRLRRWYLDSHPVCEIRKLCNGAPATEVDHIIPIVEGGERLDQRNLQATCRACHRSKTAADQRRTKREGRER